MKPVDSYPWVWDMPLDRETFRALLKGETEINGLDWRWAMARLAEYAPYADIRRLLPKDLFLRGWPEVAPRLRSPERREGMDFLWETLRAEREGEG